MPVRIHCNFLFEKLGLLSELVVPEFPTKCAVSAHTVALHEENNRKPLNAIYVRDPTRTARRK